MGRQSCQAPIWLSDIGLADRNVMDLAEHAEHSGSELTKGEECVAEGGGLRIKDGLTEPCVHHGAVAKLAFEQRPQRPKIEQAFRDVKDKHARRSIEHLNPDPCRFGHGGGADPGKEVTVADIIKITDKAAPFAVRAVRRRHIGLPEARLETNSVSPHYFSRVALGYRARRAKEKNVACRTVGCCR